MRSRSRTKKKQSKGLFVERCMLISALHHEGEEEKLHLLMLDAHIPAGAKLY